MKKSLILGLLLSATVVTACGGNGSSSKPASTPAPSTPSTSVPSTPSTPTPSTPEVEESLGVTLEELKNTDITVTFWHTMGATNMEYLNAMITNFNKIYPKITIEHDAQGGYDDIKEKDGGIIIVKNSMQGLYSIKDFCILLNPCIPIDYPIIPYTLTNEAIGYKKGYEYQRKWISGILEYY